MSNPEADRLREQVEQISQVRYLLIAWEARAQKRGIRTLADKCDELESWLLNIEDEVAACADRLDPPPTRIGGQQWLKGLTLPAVRQ